MQKDNKNKKEKKHFFRDFKAELKKVIWPTPKQLINNTIAVITIVLLTAAIVFALDFIFENMNEHGINKIKEIVESHQTVENNEETAENTENNAEGENTAETEGENVTETGENLEINQESNVNE